MKTHGYHSCGVPVRQILLAGLYLAMCSLAAAQEKPSTYGQPEQEIPWDIGKQRIATAYAGHTTTGPWIVSLPADKPAKLKQLSDPKEIDAEMRKLDDTLHMWRWEDGTLKKHHEIRSFPRSVFGVCLPGDRFLASFAEADDCWQTAVRQINTGRILRRWPQNGDWSDLEKHASANGEFVGIISALPGRRQSRARIVDIERGTLETVMTMEGSHIGAHVIPSNNGKYLVLYELWKLIGVVDVENKRFLPTFPSDGSEYATAACFSPDSKILFIGGTHCRVRAMDVKTGRELSEWYATNTGEEVDVYSRIHDISVSPNGEYVAVWTTQGMVFVWRKTTGKATKLVQSQRAGGLLAFSPDSKKLATSTFDWRAFKIWDLAAMADVPHPDTR